MRNRTVLFALLGLLVGGCVASGPIKGRLTEPGASPAPITLHYRSERFNQNGTLTATLPSGEAFSGRYLEVSEDTDAETLDPFWGGWGVGWAGWGPWGDGDDNGPWIVGADIPTFVRNYSGTVIATLLGDRGGRMRCRFRLGEPERGMSGGGVGECEVSGGGKIDAEF